MHTDLAATLRLSPSQVRDLSPHCSLPLLACHERQQRDRLAQGAKEQGGFVMAVDGLAPQGGEPHIWCSRDFSTGLTLRRGWLAQPAQPTVAAFLAPLKHREWPMLAVLSDQHTGLVPAVASGLPTRRHQCCQAHSLRNLAAPLAEADAACKVELRHTVRQHVGDLLRREPRPAAAQAGVLTVTGLWPSPLQEPLAATSPTAQPAVAPASSGPEVDAVVPQLFGPTRDLFTLKGRPPFRLAGLETSERLHRVARCSLALLAKRYEPRRAQV